MSTTTSAHDRPGAPARPLDKTAATVLPGVLLAAALTAWNYSSKPLWRDEFYTLDTARRSLPGMVALLRNNPDIGLTGYYTAMHLWLLVSTATWWLRLPGAVASVVAVGVVAFLGRRVAGTAVGVVAGLLAAALPAVVIHAQEARPYPLVLAATALTILAMLRYRERPTWGRAWTLALVAAVPGCLHPIVGLPVVVGVFAAALLRPGDATQVGVVLTSLLAAVSGGSLVVLGARVAARRGPNPTQGLARLVDLVPSLVGPWWVSAVVWSAAVAGMVAMLRARPRTTGPLPVLLGALVVPFVVVCGMGLTGSFFQLRYVSAATVPLAVLAATGLVRVASSLPRPGRTVALGAATTVVVVSLLVSAASLRRAPYYVDDPRTVTRSLARQVQGGDAVVFDGTTSRGLTTMYLPPGTALSDTLVSRTPSASRSIFGDDVPVAEQLERLSAHPRMWLIGPVSSTGGWSDPQKAVTVTAGRVLLQEERQGSWRWQLWVVQ